MVITATPPLPVHAEWRAGLPVKLVAPVMSSPVNTAVASGFHPALHAASINKIKPALFTTLYGPTTFSRSFGTPITVSDTFPFSSGTQGTFVMCINNGAADGSHRVSSAWIKLNGQNVFRPRDFNRRVSVLSAPVEPLASNEIQVRLMSEVGSFLSITIASSCTKPPNERPVANAGVDQTATVGSTVQLSGASSMDPNGDAITYQWTLASVPDGSAAVLSSPTSVSPTFVIDKPGSYTARLIVSDGNLQSAPDDVVISTVNSAPVANAGADQSVLTNTMVHLNGAESTDVDGERLTYHWEFLSIPDGSAATLSDADTVAPSFSTDKRGDYTVELSVSDGQATSTDQVTVTTLNSAPIANAGPDQTAVGGRVVQLNGSGSTDVDGDPISYSWALITKPAGSIAQLSSADSVNPSFVPDALGTYVAQLIVNDGFGPSAPDQVTITTGNTVPVAIAGDDQSVELGSLVSLSGAGSSDVDDQPLTFHWSIISKPDGSIAELSDPSFVQPSFIADRAGTYVIQLVVNDGYIDSSPSSVTITTLNSRPVADPGSEQTVTTGTTVQLSGAASTDADGDPLTYSWSILSKPNGSSATISDPQSIAPTFVADLEGPYVAQLIVNDGKVSSVPQTVMITAITPNQAPVVNAGPDQHISLPTNSVVLQPVVSDDGKPAGAELTRTWEQVSGPAGVTFNFDSSAPATATFPGIGTYVLRLTVSDSELSASDEVTVIVDPAVNQAPVVNAGPSQTVSLPVTTVQLNGTGSDDGKPSGTLQFLWSVVSAPGSVTFADARSAATQVTFSAEGTYVLRLTADDTELTASSDVTITVLPASANRAPIISAGDMALTAPNNTLVLSASVTDDGLPNGKLTTLWSQLDGPVAVQFADASVPGTTAVFDAPGTYALRITANDGVLTTSKDIHVTVFAGLGGGNQAPFVDAGRDQVVTLPATATLHGVAVDDGLPDNSLSASWQQISGPESAVLSDPTAREPIVTFSESGTYVFRLTATDGEAAAFDEVSIAVNQLNATRTNRGTDFWLMFPINGDTFSDPTLELRISGDPGTKVKVDIPALAFSQVSVVAPDGSAVIALPSKAYVSTVSAVDKKSIHVTTDRAVNIYAPTRKPQTADAYLALPRQTLGTNYIVGAYSNVDGRIYGNPFCCDGTFAAVLAPADGTRVTITPSVTGDGHTKGVPYQLTLNQGDVYMVHKKGFDGDMTGTLIDSDKPVAVWGGHECIYILGQACDVVVEQIPPTNTWGTHFVTMPLATRLKGDVFRVLAAENDTLVRYGGTDVKLDRAQFFDVVLKDPTEIISDRPVLLMQFATGTLYDGVTNADPFMTLVPPVERFGGNFTANIPDTIYVSNYANVITSAAGVNALKIDGQPISASSFKTIGSSGYAGAQIQLSSGIHTFASTQPFGGWVYGWAPAESYGYLGSIALSANNDETLELFSQSGPVSAGSTPCVVAVVKDPFGYVGGISVDFAISGVNGTSGHSETDGNGRARFCYSAANAGTDTVTASIGTQKKDLSLAVVPDLGNSAPFVAIDAPASVTLPAALHLVGVIADDGLPVASVLSMTWTVVSGPGSVSFTTPSLDATDAIFSAPGAYLIRLSVSDGELTTSSELNITVSAAPPANQAPQVNAGPDQTLDLATTSDFVVTVSATATDDGLPQGRALQYQWSILSGDFSNSATLSNANEPTTTVRFPAQASGPYTLRVAVTDGELSGSDEVVVNVISRNNRPFISTISSDPNQITLPNNVVNLKATVADDGKPVGSTLTYLWKQTFGTALAAIADPTQVNTTATLPAPGQYNFELTASDGSLSSVGGTSVTLKPANQAPRISITNGGQTITLPANKVTLNTTYTDDGVPLGVAPTLQWVQVSGPAAASFANGTFTNTDIIFTTAGSYTFKVIASDGELTADATTSITVKPDNVAPTVSAGGNKSITLPTNSVTLTGTATDDGKPTSTLTYSWVQTTGPAPATIASPSALSTSVTFPIDGTYTFQLTVSDSLLSATSSTSVFVYPGATNQAPTVFAGADQTVTMTTSPTVGVTLHGTVTDDNLPAGRTLTQQWSLASGPAPVTIGNGTSQIAFATFSAPGSYVLRLTASDTALSASSTTIVTVLPKPNTPPSIGTQGQTIVLPNTTATLTGFSSDDGLPNGTLTYQWTQVDGPAIATIQSPNALITQVTTPVAGNYNFRLTVSDSQFVTSQTTSVVVQSNREPTVSTVIDRRSIVLPDNTVNVGANVTDDGLPNNTLTYHWELAVGPAPVIFANSSARNTSVTVPLAGDYTFRVVVSDGQLSSSSTVGVTVLAPLAAPPKAFILTPGDGDYITKPVPIQIAVENGTWVLEYSENTDDGSASQKWITLASNGGFTSYPPQTVATFDPTTLRNGNYTLRLTASNGTYSTTSVDTIGIVVGGNMKVGNFTMSFNDMTVPIANLPIQIIRTNDSKDRMLRGGDFGLGGWSLSLKSVRLQKNGQTGRNWFEDAGFVGQFTQYCLNPIGHRTVTATFPDGRVYRFEAVSNRPCQTAGPISAPTLLFQQVNATAATAGATLVPVDGGEAIIDGAVPGQINLLDFNGNVYNPTQFRLTTQDGYIYDLDEKLGVTKITEPNGAYATFTTDGIFHSSGKSVTFQRNSTGQITQITDPNGNFVKYTYGFGTAGAVLTAFTDAAGKATNYTYTSFGNDFVLATISDSRGTLLTNTWTNGRLTATTDIFGKTTSYTHDLTNQVETVTDRNGNPTTYTYDDHGNVTKMVDALDNVTTYTYDENDNKTSETNALGKTTTYSYDGRGNRASETDPLGHTTNYTYNGHGQVVTVKRANGQLVTLGYDQKGNTTSVTGPSGLLLSTVYEPSGLPQITTDILNNTIQFEHDASGNVTKHVDPAGTATTFTYDSAGNQLTRQVTRTTPVGPETLLTQYEYDKNNRLTKTTAADSSFTRVVYNNLGQKSEAYDALNNKTSYTYDNSGRLTKVTYPDLTFESYTYDNEDRRLTFTNRANHTTTYERDKLGRVTKVIADDGTFVTTHYDPIGRVDYVLDQKNHKTQYVYDDANRRTQIIDPLGQTTFFTYDDIGNLKSIKDARGNTTSFDYDANNRRIQTNHPDGTTDKVEYDLGGRIISRTDQNGKKTKYEYDQLSRLKKVTDALDQATSFTYDEVGDRLTQTDAKLHTTSYEYDKLGRRTKRTLPGGQSETYTYDAAGNLKTRTDFNGKTTTYTYDSLNRLKSKVPDASFNAPSVTYTYNSLGQRLTMSDVSGTTTYTYDNRDRLITKSTPAGTLNYTYDSVSNVETISSDHADGISTTYTYDELNRLATATDLNAGSASYSYDENGNLATATAGNGVRHTYTYNTLNRLTNLSVDNSTQALAGYTYTLDNVGNRTKISEINGRVTSYVYDGLYRLARESISSDPAGQNGAIDYTYDAVGNRTSLTSTVPLITSSAGTLFYDANDRSSADSYDNNGNATVVRGQSNTYDFENRLVQRGSATVVYDGDGTRVAETVAGVTTRFLIDDLNPTGYPQVVEEIVDGTVVRSYSYGLQRIAQRQLIGSAWTTSYYSYDGHGSVRQLTDTAGNVTDTYDYDAFGNLLNRTGSTPNDMLFAGEEFDPALGVYYNRARYYDQQSGRFWSMDAFEGYGSDPATLHKYTYAANNPVSYVDPSGNDFDLGSTLTAAGIGVTLSAISGAIVQSIRTKSIRGALRGFGYGAAFGFAAAALLTGAIYVFPALGGGFGLAMLSSVGFHIGVLIGLQDFSTAKNSDERNAAIAEIVLAALALFGGTYLAAQQAALPAGETEIVVAPEPEAPLAPGTPQPYEVDTYGNLRSRDVVGDDLSNHHVPQKALARSTVTGYPQDSAAADAPAIRVPADEHETITILQNRRDSTGMNSRDLLADDIRMLRNKTNAPNESLQELIQMNKDLYPDAFRK